jgi:hypothetical protein
MGRATIPSERDRLNAIAMRVAITALWILAPLAVLGMYYRTTFVGLGYPDAMDLAQISRHLSKGHGFVTSLVRPFATAYWSGSMTNGMPDLTHAPLFPFTTAILFVAIGARDAIVGLSSAIWYLATIPIVYLLGINLFDRRVALLAVVLFLASESLLQCALTGLPVTMLMFLLSCLLLFLYKGMPKEGEDSSKRTRMYSLAGMMMALCYLTDYVYVALFPAALVFILATAGKQRRKAVVLFVLAFVVVSGPWMARNYRLTGHPVFGLKSFEVAMYTRTNPGFSMYRDAESRSLLTTVTNNVPDIVRKFSEGASDATLLLPTIPSVWIAMFFIVAIPFRFKNIRTQALRNGVYGMLGLTMVTAIAMKMNADSLVAFAPFIVVVAAALVYHVLDIGDVKGWKRAAAITSLVVVVAYPAVNTVATHRQGPSDQMVEFLNSDLPKVVGSETAIASDVPWKVAWYSDRTSVWLPKDDSFISARRKGLNTDVVILSNSLLMYPRYEKLDLWKRAYMTGQSWSKDFVLMTDERAPIRVFGRISAFKNSAHRG